MHLTTAELTAKLKLTTMCEGLPLSDVYRNFKYIRNTGKAPKMTSGDQFQQNIEPAGRYMLQDEGGHDLPSGWERGSVYFKNPYVIRLNAGNSERVYDDQSWKMVLSKLLKARGRQLSLKMRKLGYDAIITVQKNKYTGGVWESSECVDLTVIT